MVASLALLLLIFFQALGVSFSEVSAYGSDYAEGKLLIKFRDGLLHIKANAIPLDDLLKELSARTKVKIHLVGSLSQKVTFRSRKIPLDQALIKLVEGTADYMFVYSQPSTLKEVWIFSDSEGAPPVKVLSGDTLSQRLGSKYNLAQDSREIDAQSLLSTPVEELLKSQNANVRLRVVEMLGELRDEQAVEDLISVLDDEDEDVRESAVYALAQIGSRQAVEPLITRLGDESPWVRASAAEALAKIRDESALSYLVEALHSETDEDARESMNEALNKLTR